MDEVNSMDLSLQAKILKAIEEKRFRPVGGEQDVHSDVRIVSAMNVDPITAVREGLLRRDLFYRLGAVQLACHPCGSGRRTFRCSPISMWSSTTGTWGGRSPA